MALLAILALSLALRLAFVHEPFERDEGHYGYIGQEILRGGIPYRDAIDVKPPGVYYLYALGIALFGETPEGMRLFTAFFALGTVLLVHAIARAIGGPRAGLAAALLAGIFSSGPRLQGSGSNAEVFMVFPALLGFHLLLRAVESGRKLHLYGSGLAAGSAMLIKTVAFPQAFLLFALRIAARGDPKTKLLDLLRLVSPMIGLFLLTVAYFSYQGVLAEFFYWNVTFVAFAYRALPLTGPTFARAAAYLAPEFALLLLLGVPTSIWILWQKRDWNHVAAVLLVAAACIAIWLPKKNFPHYYIQLVPPLAILSGIGAAGLLQQAWRRRLVAAAAIGLAFAYFVREDYRYYLVYTPEQVSFHKYGPTFVQSVAVARYLKDRTSPSDYVFQWGFEPELYFLSGRRSPVAHVASVLVAWDRDPPAAVQEMIRSLHEKKPAYIVVQPEWSSFPGVDEVVDVILRDYRAEARIGYAHIYRRR